MFTRSQKLAEEHADQIENPVRQSLEVSEQYVMVVDLQGQFGTQKNHDRLEDGEPHQNVVSDGPEQALPTVPSAKERSLLITARAIQLSKIYNTFKRESTNSYVYSVQPPTWLHLKNSLQSLGLPDKIYQPPYYSKDFDIPEHTKEYAGLTYRLKGGQGIATLEEWSPSLLHNASSSTMTLSLVAAGVGGWEYASHPPSVKEIRQSIKLVPKLRGNSEKSRSQVRFLTQMCLYIRLKALLDRGAHSSQHIWIQKFPRRCLIYFTKKCRFVNHVP